MFRGYLGDIFTRRRVLTSTRRGPTESWSRGGNHTIRGLPEHPRQQGREKIESSSRDEMTIELGFGMALRRPDGQRGRARGHVEDARGQSALPLVGQLRLGETTRLQKSAQADNLGGSRFPYRESTKRVLRSVPPQGRPGRSRQRALRQRRCLRHGRADGDRQRVRTEDSRRV